MFLYQFTPDEKAGAIQHIKQFINRRKQPGIDFANFYVDHDDNLHLLGSFEGKPRGKAIYRLSEDEYIHFLDTFKPTIKVEEGAYSAPCLKAEAEARRKVIAIAKNIQSDHNQEAAASDKHDAKHATSITGSIPVDAEDAVEHIIHSNAPLLSRMQQAYETGVKKGLQGQAAVSQIGPPPSGISQLDIPHELIQAIADLPEEIPTPSPDLWKTCANIGIQDGIWSAQSTATEPLVTMTSTAATSGLSGGAAAAVGATVTIGCGLIFGVGMGVLCSKYSAHLYEKHAIAQFKMQHNGEEPTILQKKLIRRDAKHLGYKIFGAMTGWSISASILESAFTILKYTNNFHPHGWIINTCISVAAGVGEAVGVCYAHRSNEKSKFCNEKGELVNKEGWEKHSSSSDYKNTMARLAVASFVSGFAWNMIGQYLPKPVAKGIKKFGSFVGANGSKAGKKAIQVSAFVFKTMTTALVTSIGITFTFWAGLGLGKKGSAPPLETKSKKYTVKLSSLFCFFKQKQTKGKTRESSTSNGPSNQALNPAS